MTIEFTTTQQRVIDCFVDKLGLDEADVTLDADLRNDLDLDSLELVEAAMAIEEEFEIEVSSEDLEQYKTVGDVVRFAEKLVNPEIATAQK